MRFAGDIVRMAEIALMLGMSISTSFQGAAAAAAEARPSAAVWVPPDAAAWQDLTPAIAAIADDPTDIALCTVAVDRTNGWLYAQPQNCGLWRSKDQGRTFQQIGRDVIIKGTRHSHSWASVQVHPEGGKIAVFSMCSYWRVPMGLCGYSLDGGDTWQEFVKFGRQPTAGAMNWDGDSSVVLCSGWPDHRGLFYSSDGGRHWIRRDWSKMDCFYQGYGIFSPSVLVTSTGEITLRSEDAGKTWTEIGRHGACGPVWFFKGKPYWMSNSGILTSGDAGKTWTLVGSKLPAWGVAGPYFGKDERHIVVATATGFFETFDGGNAWHKLAPYPPVFAGVGFLWSSFGYDPFHDILYAHVDRTQTKFKYGESGGTAKLELRRWTAAAAPARAEKPPAAPRIDFAAPCLSGVWFTNPQTGFAVGERGTILRTADGGASWTLQQTAGPRDHLYAVHFTSAETGYVAGELGTIRKTTDGGATWVAQTSGTKDTLCSLWFTEADTGCAVGDRGTVLKTIDGGEHWTAQTSGTNAWLSSVYFPDRTTGYAVGESGTILKTTDAGAHWLAQASGTRNHLYAVHFPSAKIGYVVGDRGTILKTTDGGVSSVAQSVRDASPPPSAERR
jgi:photosystem II stability/assembly factor-like uncharacterized protein